MIRLLRYCIFLVILSSCAGHFHVSETKSTHYELKNAKNDSLANLSLLPYKVRIDREMSEVIAYSDTSLTRDGFESSLGNFVLLALEEYVISQKPKIADSCVLFVNRGGLRNNLPKGEITRGNIFELMPFDNGIVVISITGQKLFEAIDRMLNDKKIISMHLKMEVEDKEPKNIMINNTPIDLTKNYVVITTDYLANGGDNCSFFGQPIFYNATGVKLRDAIMSYCNSLTKDNKHIKPYRIGAIKISK